MIYDGSRMVIDITKSSKEIIFDKINAANGLMLEHNDFLLEDPQVEFNALYNTNTSVVIKPNLLSEYYNSKKFFYNRMDLADVLDNKYISIKRGNAENLSELIDVINEAYDIHLTMDDYYDTPLTIIDPNDPDELITVTVAAKPESYLFHGTFDLVLNRLASVPAATSRDASTIYVLIERVDDPDYKTELRAYDTDGEYIYGFSFLSNVEEINKCDAREFIRRKNGNLILFGDFEFVKGGLTISSNCITIANTGALLSWESDLFGCSNENNIYFTNKYTNDVYSIDFSTSDGNDNNCIVKYEEDGSVDNTYEAKSLEVRPVFIKVCEDGRVYVVNEQTTDEVAPGEFAKVRTVQRLMADGELDPEFNTISIRDATRSDVALDIVDLEADFYASVHGGLFIYVRPLGDVQSYNTYKPVVNGELLVSVTDPAIEDYGILPLLRFDFYGNLDTDFEIHQRRYSPKSVGYFDVSSMGGTLLGKYTDLLNVSEHDVTMLCMKPNPITGHEHVMPSRYSPHGTLRKLTGDEYFTTYRFSEISNSIGTYSGQLVVMGSARLMLPGGVYSVPQRLVVVYNKETAAHRVIFTETDEGNGYLKIRSVVISDSV